MTVLLREHCSAPHDPEPNRSSRTALTVLVVLAALCAGAGVAWAPLLAVGAAAGLLFTVLLLRDPVLALALWIPSLFLEAVPP